MEEDGNTCGVNITSGVTEKHHYGNHEGNHSWGNINSTIRRITVRSSINSGVFLNIPSKGNMIANPDPRTPHRPAQFAGDRCRRNTSLRSMIFLASALFLYWDSDLKHSYRMVQDQLKSQKKNDLSLHRRLLIESGAWPAKCPRSDWRDPPCCGRNSMLKVTSELFQGKDLDPNLVWCCGNCCGNWAFPQHCGCVQYKLHLGRVMGKVRKRCLTSHHQVFSGLSISHKIPLLF